MTDGTIALPTPEAIAAALSARLEATGWPHRREGARLALGGGTVLLGIRAPEQVPSANGVVLSVPFALASTLFIPGIAERAYHGGSTLDAALDGIVRQIADEVVPALVEGTTGTTEFCGLEVTDALSPAVIDRLPPGWRIVLGPLWRWTATGQAPCCIYCILTVSSGALMPLFERPGPMLLRIFAARQADGSGHADCRVGGVPQPDMAAAIVERIRLWPESDGATWRRQTIVLARTIPVAA